MMTQTPVAMRRPLVRTMVTSILKLWDIYWCNKEIKNSGGYGVYIEPIKNYYSTTTIELVQTSPGIRSYNSATHTKWIIIRLFKTSIFSENKHGK